ncbi:hypothetical protein [Burkholderia sp. BCC0322]|uniref:hypothetical protein n=1 Tax=unclassified Burkholderia TaxID=2613784 RepID=UPI00158931C5|nr:hypothetical protein [Burkholderia sp. BCC0322]
MRTLDLRATFVMAKIVQITVPANEDTCFVGLDAAVLGMPNGNVGKTGDVKRPKAICPDSYELALAARVQFAYRRLALITDQHEAADTFLDDAMWMALESGRSARQERSSMSFQLADEQVLERCWQQGFELGSEYGPV